MLRKPLTLIVGPIVLAAIGACTTTANVSGQLRPRAAFDLECPPEQLRISVLAGSGGSGLSSYGVEGCGRRARYETMCSGAGSHCIVELEGSGGGERKKAALEAAASDD